MRNSKTRETSDFSKSFDGGHAEASQWGSKAEINYFALYVGLGLEYAQSYCSGGGFFSALSGHNENLFITNYSWKNPEVLGEQAMIFE